MIAESQNIEWKESWRDEYLKWICGFANAQGGKIYIGKKDDGTVIGVSDARKLMEDIPNKIQNKLGIVADVNLLTENGAEYIEIAVSPWSFPVNYDGEYHYRSGSTKQQLRGSALTNFLMSKTGIRWDAATDVMYISNSSLLPFGWTAETLMEAHSSKPFNPDIANVFYRAGYIESWGRGIQKICDACKSLGADEPVYILHGEDIMVKFYALQSAIMSDPKVPKHQSTADHGALDDALVQRILEVLRRKPEISQGEMAEELGTTRRVIQKKMILLKEAGSIERVGGKRYGHWIIHE